jgi:anti-anti-sigma factor
LGGWDVDGANTLDCADEGVLVWSDGREQPIPPHGLLIGRRADADLPLNDPEVSRRHAQIESRNGRFIVVDLGSSNGTLLNGERVAGERGLADGDVLKIGAASLTFRVRRRPASDLGPEMSGLAASPIQPADLPMDLGPAVKRTPPPEAPAPPRLAVTAVEAVGSPGALVTLVGVLDIETVELLEEQVEPLLHRNVVQFTLEMGEVEYVDSSGLAALVALRREASAGGGSVRLQHVQPSVRGIIELTRLDRVFDLQ